jgi:hypothetical protein
MKKQVATYRRSHHLWLAFVVTTLLGAMPAFAGHLPQASQGQQESARSVGVLPPQAQPQGYSLADIAKITAAFNVTDHSGTVPSAVDGSGKIQMLYTTADNTFQVKSGTFLYVPILTPDDSPPILGTFPNINDRNAVVNYAYSPQQLGIQYTIITIDGQAFPLDERYLVAVRVPPLPDGGGTGYLAFAAFVKPLKKGTHTIEISASATGAAVIQWCQDLGGSCPDGFAFSITYTVIVH